MAKRQIIRLVPKLPPETIVTLGYAAVAIEDFDRFMLEYPNAFLVESRRTPFSKVHVNWNAPALKKRYGDRYVLPGPQLPNRVSNPLGNVGQGHKWQSSDMAAAIRFLCQELPERLERNDGFPVFLCAEADHRQCHRGWKDGVADLCQSLWDGWEIFHLWTSAPGYAVVDLTAAKPVVVDDGWAVVPPNAPGPKIVEQGTLF